MNEIKTRYLGLLSAQSALKANPSNLALAHSLMIIFMSFVAYAESSEHYTVVAVKDKMVRNDIAHSSQIPIANGLVVKKIYESINDIGRALKNI